MSRNVFQSPSSEYMDTDSFPELLPPELWSYSYLVNAPNVLSPATKLNPTRVAQIFADDSKNSKPAHQVQVPVDVPSTVASPNFKITAPAMTLYDGQPATLRAFCSQLSNQINSCEHQFPTEMAKVQFAYQCLGPGALVKMRSSFRCLEDPTVPAEITTLADFLSALKQRCQDPNLREKATLAVESLYQKDMEFHDFITLFEDNMADSSYGHLDKENWKAMLTRRLSSRLRNALVFAHDAPKEYHSFVSYLRKKDAALQEINGRQKQIYPQKLSSSASVFSKSTSFNTNSHFAPQKELTVSQGGSAMDLDTVSREKGPDGRLTMEAKNARRSLGRCYRCNKTGHLALNCPLGKSPVASVSSVETIPSVPEPLKE